MLAGLLPPFFFKSLSHELTLCNPMDWSPPGSSVHGDFPGQNPGVGSCSLLQGIFPTQGSNPDFLHCRQIFYHLSHQGSPRILEWVACPLSRGFSWPRNRTRVSCIAGRFFTNWATREAQGLFPSEGTENESIPGLAPGFGGCHPSLTFIGISSVSEEVICITCVFLWHFSLNVCSFSTKTISHIDSGPIPL